MRPKKQNVHTSTTPPPPYVPKCPHHRTLARPVGEHDTNGRKHLQVGEYGLRLGVEHLSRTVFPIDCVEELDWDVRGLFCRKGEWDVERSDGSHAVQDARHRGKRKHSVSSHAWGYHTYTCKQATRAGGIVYTYAKTENAHTGTYLWMWPTVGSVSSV